MRSFLPDSIASRTMLVLLVGLILSQIVSIAILSHDRLDALAKANALMCARNIAMITHIIDGTPPEARPALVSGLGSSLMAITLTDHADIPVGHQDDDHFPQVQAALADYFPDAGHSRLHAAHRAAKNIATGNFWVRLLNGFPSDRLMEASFRFDDGTWVNYEMVMAEAATLWSPRVVLSALGMVVAVVVFGMTAARWVGRPLLVFAAAADRLGRDVNAPPLPESGPREVRRAIAAFNEMQRRIRRFVDDRTQLLAAISHDLRSPVTRLRLRTEILADGVAREKMLGDLGEMEAMIASTLDFARGEAADEKNQTIDLAAMLSVVCDNAVDMGLAVSYDWEGRQVCVCRPFALKRALVNLIENAARYGGNARVSTAYRNQIIQVIIDDDGPGIPDAEIEKVFNPFYRIEGSRNRRSGGIGLGLTVARTIVRSHGGDIRLSNRVGGGLRVEVSLPQEADR